MSCRNYWDARIYRGHSGVTQRNGPQGLRHDDDDDDDDNPQLYLQLQTVLASTVLCLLLFSTTHKHETTRKQ